MLMMRILLNIKHQLLLDIEYIADWFFILTLFKDFIRCEMLSLHFHSFWFDNDVIILMNIL